MSDPLARLIAELPVAKRALLARLLQPAPEPIAVIGIGCRFPGGANGPDGFWRLLADGVDAVSEVPADRWDVDAFYDPDPRTPGTMSSRWGAFLDQVDHFDPDFFGISRREALAMDPQQRLLLEVAWEALEDAGQVVERLAGTRAGVFMAIYHNDYASAQFADRMGLDAYAVTGSAHSIAANRLSYLLDLRGPSMAVDTACSSSLVAVHLAGRTLQSGECDLALAGGVSVMLSPLVTIPLSKWGMLAPDGRCKTFDAAADGFVRGEGCGVVVLKRLSDALADGDPIRAIVRGSAVNQDGRTNVLTAPNGLSQRAVVRQALANAGVEPSEVSYVEAHGTGTALGDPIELEALAELVGRGRADGGPCLVGSVKTNLGHLEAAAGMAGLIKVALALEREAVPPHLHFRSLNPNVSLANTRLAIPTELRPWPRGERPRVGGVSSFGFGGTNAHVVVEEAPGCRVRRGGSRTAPPDGRQGPRSGGRSDSPAWMLPLSARGPGALRELAITYRCWLRGDGPDATPATPLYDVCYTASVRRSHHHHRLAVAGRTREELAAGLDAFVRGDPWPGLTASGSAEHPPRADGLGRPGRIDAATEILESFATPYVLGQEVDWHRLFPTPGRCVPLPPYPWQRQRYRLDVPNAAPTTPARSPGGETPPEPDALAPRLLAAGSPNERERLLVAYLRRQVAAVLELAPDALDLERPLIRLGLDSLTASELKHRVARDLRADVPTVRFLDGTSVAGLAALIAARLDPATPNSPADVTSPSSAESDQLSAVPLSFAQQRLWILHQLRPDGAGYNIALAADLRGPLDRSALEESLTEVTRRHEALRTTFVVHNGQLVQRIGTAAPVRLPVADLGDLPESGRRARLDELAGAEARRPFDLAGGPLLRGLLARLGQDHHVLVLAMHHIVSDGWSLGVLARELVALYEAIAQGRPPSLPELPIQYRDFARWQRRQVLDDQLAYWKARLGGAPPALPLPVDHPRPVVGQPRGARRRLTLPADLVRRLDRWSRGHGSTPFMTLLTALEIVLFKWTGQRDLVVGTVTANREWAGTEHLIGCFMNFLALRTTLPDDASGLDLLERVRSTVLDAYAHQDCPFDLVVEALNPRRAERRNPLYNVAFLYQGFDYLHRPHKLGLGDGLEVAFEEIATGESILDLRFIAERGPTEIGLVCEYDADQFEAGTIDDVLARYRTVLDELLRDPRTRLSRFSGPERPSAAGTGPAAAADEILAELELLSDEQAARMLRDAGVEAKDGDW